MSRFFHGVFDVGHGSFQSLRIVTSRLSRFTMDCESIVKCLELANEARTVNMFPAGKQMGYLVAVYLAQILRSHAGEKTIHLTFE